MMMMEGVGVSIIVTGVSASLEAEDVQLPTDGMNLHSELSSVETPTKQPLI